MDLNLSSNNVFPKVHFKGFEKPVIENRPSSKTTSKPDEFVSNNAQTEKENVLTKYRKAAAIIGGGALLVIGSIFGKKKIDAKKAKELEAKAKEAAEQAREAAIQKQKAENARLEERAKQIAKEKADRLAKLEQEKIAAQKEKETQLAQARKALEEKIHKEKLQGFNNFKAPNVEELIGAEPDVSSKINSIYYTMCFNGTFKITNLIKKLEELGNHKLSREEIKSILENLRLPQTTLEKLDKEANAELSRKVGEVLKNNPYTDGWAKTHPVEFVQNSFQSKDYIVALKDRNNEINSILKILDETPMLAEETTSAYFKRLISSHRQIKNTEYNAFQAEIKRKAKPTIQTTDEMFKEATEYYRSSQFVHDSYIDDYVGGGVQLLGLSKEGQIRTLERLPKFAYPTPDKNACLSRYIRVGEGGIDDFLRQFEQEGAVYEFKELASCAKTTKGAESSFRDRNPDMNVKFVIHPKGEHPIFEARDIGLCKYGASEVLYAPGSKFKYIGKMRYEANPEVDKELLNDAGEFIGKDPFAYQSFNRWEIHLQEM